MVAVVGRLGDYNQAVSCRESNVHPFVVEYAKLKQSQLFEHGGIYGIEWRLAKSKLSNELERGGTYGMTYDTYI